MTDVYKTIIPAHDTSAVFGTDTGVHLEPIVAWALYENGDHVVGLTASDFVFPVEERPSFLCYTHDPAGTLLEIQDGARELR